MEKLNHTDNGNGQMAIIDENLRCVAFIPKLHPDSERYIKLFESSPEMLDAIKKAELDFNLLGIKEHAPMRKNLLDIIKKATS